MLSDTFQGKSHNGLLQHLQSSFDRSLYHLIQYVFTIFTSNFTMEEISSTLATSSKSNNIELLKVIGNIIMLPASSALHPSLLQSSPSFEFEYPAKTLFFDYISTRLIRLLAICDDQYSHNTPDLFASSFISLVSTDPISAAISFVESNPSILATFTSDFYNRVIKVTFHVDEWNHLLNSFFLYLSIPTSQSTPILQLYLIWHLRLESVTRMCTEIQPMLKLTSPDVFISSFVQSFKDPRSVGGKEGETEKTLLRLNAIIAECTIECMWDRLKRIRNFPDYMENWKSVFMGLHSRYPLSHSLVGIVSEYHTSLWNILTVYYLFIAPFSVSLDSTSMDFISKTVQLQKLKSTFSLVTYFAELIGE